MTEQADIVPNTHDALDELLSELADHPERLEEVTERIVERFGQRRAVVVMDMSGFTRTTRTKGIVSFLLMIHQVRKVAVPVVDGHGGVVVKAEADNLWCLFDTVPEAVLASEEIQRRLEVVNLVLPKDRELYLSVGIGFGPILNIGDRDVFGDEVNLAGKLGEDIAERGEVLLSGAARAEMDGGDDAFEEHAVSVSGLDLRYYTVR